MAPARQQSLQPPVPLWSVVRTPVQSEFASEQVPEYDASMAKLKQLEFDQPSYTEGDEDEETLAAIDEGIRDAEAGRTATPEEARKLLSKWITESSTLKDR